MVVTTMGCHQVQRQDGKEFRVEDKAKYSIAVVCHPDLGTRKQVIIRLDALDRSSIIPDVRIEEDPTAIIKMLSEKYGFQLPKAHACHFEPAGPWNSGQQLRTSTRISMAFGAVRFPHYVR
jgi:hypothetical protein